MGTARSVWRRDVLGWSLYDFANTMYSMNIVSLYLKRYVVEDLGHDDHFFDVPFSISMAIAALVLPALGAMSDHSAKKKVFLFLFTFTCCTAVGLMALVPSHFILSIILLFIVANFSYEAGQPFYNALLYSVADGPQARYVSGIGVSMGYVGSIIGMVFVLPFVTGELFGWDVPFLHGGGKQGSFLPTAVLFLIFALPLFLWVHEARFVKPKKVGVAASYREVWDGVRQTRKYPGVLRFLIADYFFEDAAATVIINIGLYCSLVLGLMEGEISTFLIICTVSAVAGSFAIGKIAQHWSLKRMLTAIVWGWIAVLILFVLTDDMAMVYVLGSVLGILFGGLWTTSRPMLAELVPREDLGRFFGLFSLSGRAAAVVGPLIWSITVYSCNAERVVGKVIGPALGDVVNPRTLPYKIGVLSLAVMMVVGLLIFHKVPDRREHVSG